MLLTVPEAAQRLRISRSTAYQLIQTDRFPVPVVKVGDRYRIPAARLEAFLDGTTESDVS